jgi:hypothetical protein
MRSNMSLKFGSWNSETVLLRDKKDERKEIKQRLNEARALFDELEFVLELKTPYHEKLPDGTEFKKHFVNKMETTTAAEKASD